MSPGADGDIKLTPTPRQSPEEPGSDSLESTNLISAARAETSSGAASREPKAVSGCVDTRAGEAGIRHVRVVRIPPALDGSTKYGKCHQFSLDLGRHAIYYVAVEPHSEQRPSGPDGDWSPRLSMVSSG